MLGQLGIFKQSPKGGFPRLWRAASRQFMELKMAFNLSAIEMVPNRHLPSDFKKAVAMLKRPYQVITKQEYDAIVNLAVEAKTDIVLHNGQQKTFGEADGGYALMPLANPI